MTCCRARNKSQVHRHSKSTQLVCSVHCNIVNSGNVAKCIERSNLSTDAHELVNIVLTQEAGKTQVFLIVACICDFIVTEKVHIKCRVKRHVRFFIFVKRSYKLKHHKSAAPMFCCGFIIYGLFLRKKSAQHILVGVRQPALLRRAAELAQSRPRKLCGFRQRKPLAAAFRACFKLFCYFPETIFLKEGQHFFLCHIHMPQKGLFCQCPTDSVVKSSAFFHSHYSIKSFRNCL